MTIALQSLIPMDGEGLMESSWIHEEMETLRKLRDELRVQINLAGREAKDRFRAADRRWKELEKRTRRIGNASKLAADDIGAGLRELAREVRKAYEHVRHAL
jgi:hypothetical protein